MRRALVNRQPSLWVVPRHLSAAPIDAFDYQIYRKIVREAYGAARQAIRRPVAQVTASEVIAPFGFEIFCAKYLEAPRVESLEKRWPDDPTRLYPALSIPSDMSRPEAENFACLFAALLRIIAREQYPELHDRLAYIGVHRNGRYSHLTAENCTTEGLKHVKTMHIELFKTDDILEHYANYMVCLFGALVSNNRNMPEIRSFDEINGSKTGRNRLFQLFTMCHALAKILMDLPEFTAEQQALYDSIFSQLRIQNPSELIEEVPTMPIAISRDEFLIRDELIFPYIKLMQAQLAAMTQPRQLFKSEAYYDGQQALEASVPTWFAAEVKRLVKQSYLGFPGLTAIHGSVSAATPRR